MRKTLCLILAGLSLVLFSNSAVAEEKKKPAGGPPPMLVSTAEIVAGKAEPTAQFVGTIYFSRTSKVAAEVNGIVRNVYAGDGRKVKAGDWLIRLDDDLLTTQLAGISATYKQNQLDLEQAQRDYARIATLHEQDAISTSEYESHGTRVSRLQQQVIVLKARHDQLLLEQKKKTVKAPFSGIIIESLVEVGEWVAAGGIIATVADNKSFEAQVDIPANIIPFLTPGEDFLLHVAGQEISGQFIAVIPRGDITTRTFIAKFKLPGSATLIEGMQAQITLPITAASESLLVPRDAVISSYGQNVVFINNAGKARKVAVEITGHTGTMVGIEGGDIAAGQMVVVKGNERIRDGQSVRTE